jgi:alpha-N-arabinofuranosidase
MKIENPILRGFNPDPSVCRVGGDYYLATSTFAYFPAVPIYHSRDLANWRLIGHALHDASEFDFSRATNGSGIFAPTLRHHNGVFYLVTTLMGGPGNFLVTATNPAGPWSKPIWNDKENFDPSLLFDDDGTVYYTRRAHQSIVQATFDPTTGQLTSPLQKISDNFVGTDIEGPHLYKIHGLYYLVGAEGGTRSGHCAVVGRSTSPWGPFESCPWNPVLSHRSLSGFPIRDCGHAEFIEMESGQWVAFFLGARAAGYEGFPHLGRETFLAPLEWRDGWPVINGGKPVPLSLEIPGAPEPHPWPAEPTRDDFDTEVLAPGWIHHRTPPAGSFTLSKRPGYLRLYGMETALSKVGPVTFVGRRQTEFAQRFTARIEFAPTQESEETGLSIFMNENHHYALALTGTELGNGLRVLLRKRVDDLDVITAQAELPAGPVELSIEGEKGRYHFRYRQGTADWQTLGTAVAKHLTPELAGTWTGVVWALYATGNGAPSQAPADVDWVEWS